MLQRIFAIIEKEFHQALRDRVTLAIMIAMPLIQLFLFGYAISTNVRDIPTVVADQSLDSASRAYLDAMVNSGYFRVTELAANQEGMVSAIDDGRVHAGILIPAGFSEKLARGEAQVLVLVDGSDLFTSQSAYNAANLIGQAHGSQVLFERIQKSGTPTLPSLSAHLNVLYNPDLKDLWFIIPGMIAMVLQTQTIVLTAAAVVRERESGTIEQILVTPIRPIELMIGKIVPYLLMALINMLTVVGLGVFWFQVPFQGSFALFTGLTLLYVFSGLGLGLLLSTISQNQRQVNQLIMLIMTVGLVLGGFIFPRYTMPDVIRWAGSLFPLTYFIPISRGIITKGIGLEALSGDVIALVIYIAAVLILASLAFRQRLE